MADVSENPDFDPFDLDEVEEAWPECPRRFLDSLKLYVDHRKAPGHFLKAVLENDLVQAIGRADEESLGALRSIVGVIYNHLPFNSWGSPTQIEAWLKKKEQE